MNDVTGADILTLVILALPVAAISWAFTHEELFREIHDRCVERATTARGLLARKFFYLLTCEYCFSHYVAAGMLLLSRFTLLFDDWRGYFVTWFALVWVANHFISLYGRLRLGIRSERLEIGLKEAVNERAGVSKMDDHPKAKDRRAG
ncbi:MAG TPA: hypothetical protein VJM31_16045 [Vicinamibacterales bacterium]|nr:hypothetical protein [Vicinamibacterales bacterium]